MTCFRHAQQTRLEKESPVNSPVSDCVVMVKGVNGDRPSYLPETPEEHPVQTECRRVELDSRIMKSPNIIFTEKVCVEVVGLTRATYGKFHGCRERE